MNKIFKSFLNEISEAPSSCCNGTRLSEQIIITLKTRLCKNALFPVSSVKCKVQWNLLGRHVRMEPGADAHRCWVTWFGVERKCGPRRRPVPGHVPPRVASAGTAPRRGVACFTRRPSPSAVICRHMPSAAAAASLHGHFMIDSLIGVIRIFSSCNHGEIYRRRYKGFVF